MGTGWRELVRRSALRVANRAAGSGHHEWHRPDRVWLDLEQPPSVDDRPRWGHGRPQHPLLHRLIARHAAEYERWLDAIGTHAAALAAIPEPETSPEEPAWRNDYFSGLDAAALYTFLRERNPATYLEIGSGHSTRFARRAQRDGSLGTRIVSVDPEPRAGIDQLCDETIRSRLEQADLDRFASLVPGDMVLFDGSHRAFMNNDVTVFFLEVLPALDPGVLVGIHDVTLPDDYFPGNARMYWTEQYLLAVALIAGADGRVTPVLPCHHVCVDPELKRRWDGIWNGVLPNVNGYGSTFWLTSRMIEA
jgi:hypothetical protein